MDPGMRLIQGSALKLFRCTYLIKAPYYNLRKNPYQFYKSWRCCLKKNVHWNLINRTTVFWKIPFDLQSSIWGLPNKINTTIVQSYSGRYHSIVAVKNTTVGVRWKKRERVSSQFCETGRTSCTKNKVACKVSRRNLERDLVGLYHQY